MELKCDNDKDVSNYQQSYKCGLESIMEEDLGDDPEISHDDYIRSFPDPALTCDVRVLSNILDNSRNRQHLIVDYFRKIYKHKLNLTCVKLFAIG